MQEETTKEILSWYEHHAEDVRELNDALWRNPEVSLQEFDACEYTAGFMEREGFEVSSFNLMGTGPRPNTLVAKWGSGHPVVAFVGEFDALPDLGQQAVSHFSKIEGPGHGCGHCMILTGCATAAAATRQAMEKSGLPGTIVFFGCPGEEIGMGKVQLIERGYLKDVDVCLHWHPQPQDYKPSEWEMQAMTHMEVTFKGTTCHAVFSYDGRSALDAAELGGVGIQYLREHVTRDITFQYCYLEAGKKANIIPDRAVLSCIVRGKNREKMAEGIERVKKVYEGAAMMTGTSVSFKVYSSNDSTLVNHSLNRVLYEAGKKMPEIVYDDAEIAFANELYQSIYPKKKLPERVLANGITKPNGVSIEYIGSSDMSDVSRVAPSALLFGGGMLLGTTLHHWGVTAIGGHSIGYKSIVHAGEMMAQCACDIYQNPELVQTFWEEHRQSTQA